MKYLIFIFYFIFLFNFINAGGLYEDQVTEYNSLVNLFTKTGVINYYPINSTGSYNFCGATLNSTVTSVDCTSSYYNFVNRIIIKCKQQDVIYANDFNNNFRQLFFDSIFNIQLSQCTVEPGFLTKFSGPAKSRVSYITLDRCTNALVTSTGIMPFRDINVYLDTAITFTLDLAQLNGSSFSIEDYYKNNLPHSIYYTNTQTNPTQIVTLTLITSHYPPINDIFDIAWLNLYFTMDYDITSMSNVLNYNYIKYFKVYEQPTSTRMNPLPVYDLILNKVKTDTIDFTGNFYTDRILDYSGFTSCIRFLITQNNYNRNFSAPGNIFPIKYLPPNLIFSPSVNLGLSGIGGRFLTTQDYSVFRVASAAGGGIFNFGSLRNGINGQLPNWDQSITIKSLDLSSNSLTGTIDSSFCSIPSFKFNGNALQGTIPSCFKCYMQKTAGSITITGNKFTNNNNNDPCKSIIPILIVNSTKSYLTGVDLGFSASYITSVPTATWTMVTPSYLFTTPTKFAAGTLVSITHSVLGKIFTLPVTPGPPLYNSVIATNNEVITFTGSYLTYNSSDVTITLYDKNNQPYSCIVWDSGFYSISCNITNFNQIQSSGSINIKTIIKVGIYSNQLSINFGIINSPINLCSDNQCPYSNSYCLTTNATCICNYGFTGLPSCSTVYYDCLNDCSSLNGGGICDHSVVGGKCNCNSGRSGIDCSDIQCPSINSNICSGFGTCNSKTGKCSCNSGRSGNDCSEIQCPSINADSCSGNGTCDTKTGICSCTSNYSGNDCSDIKCPTSNSNICSGFGTCNSKNGLCTCSPGRSGSDCSNIQCPSINANLCSGNGTCDIKTGICSCTSNYYGSDCTDIKCPSINSNDCSGFGTCNSKTGLCTCIPGRSGSDCSKIQCPSLNSNECSGNGACDSKTGICSCKSNYYGIDCTDIQCPSVNSDICSGNGECNTKTGVCLCDIKYTGNNCSDIKQDCLNDCTSINHGTCNYLNGQCNCLKDWQNEDCSIPLIQCNESCIGGKCDNQTGSCNYECNCLHQAKCKDNTGICDCPIEYIGNDCSIVNQWVSGFNEVHNIGDSITNVTLYGWFGNDEQNDLIVTIGENECKSPILLDNSTITCKLSISNIDNNNNFKYDINVTENNVIWIGKDIFQYEVKQGNCLNNCSNNGVCDESNGKCTCYSLWKGPDCNSPNHNLEDIESSNENNNSNNKPPITNVNENGVSTIKDDYNTYEILITKLIELDFNGNTIKSYSLQNNWKFIKNDSLSVKSFSQNLEQDSKLVYIIEEIDETKDISFTGIDYTLDKGSLKISILIENYSYSNSLNTLQIQMETSTYEIENERDPCNKQSTEIETSSNQLTNYVIIKKDNKILYGRFINRVISDNRTTLLSTAIEPPSDSNSITTTIKIDLPHGKNLIIDPDFSLLLTTSFKDSCDVDDKRKSYVIPVAVVASVFGVSAASASAFLIYRKKKIEFSASKLKSKLNKLNK